MIAENPEPYWSSQLFGGRGVIFGCGNISIFIKSEICKENILSRATFPGAPSHGGVRTWVEGSQNAQEPRIG